MGGSITTFVNIYKYAHLTNILTLKSAKKSKQMRYCFRVNKTVPDLPSIFIPRSFVHAVELRVRKYCVYAVTIFVLDKTAN